MSGRATTIFIALLASLVLSAPALAQTTPTQETYGGDQGDVIGVVDESPPAPEGDGGDEESEAAPPIRTERGAGGPPSASAGGELPFTGFEALIVALAGAALVGTGLAVRRAARHPA